MRPAAYASRPPSTPSRIARAIVTGSSAREIALAHSTASQPTSIASAASDAVPTPASRITGTDARSWISRRLYLFSSPMPEPIGEPSGMTAAHPTSSSRRARIGSSFVYGSTTKPSSTSSSAASSSAGASGSSVRSSPTTSSLTQSVSNASRASLAVSTASRAVKQPAVFGSSFTPARSSTSTIEPRADGSIRRRATVTSSEPEDSIAAARPSNDRNPPVPSSSRDRSVRPPMERTSVSVAAISASLDRAQDLHPRPFVQQRLTPLAAGNHLGVDRHRHAAPGRRQVERRDRRGDRGAVLQHGVVAVQDDLHAGTPANRSGSDAPAHDGSGSPASTPATTSAVTGVSRIPLRKWPVAHTSPSSAPGPIAGRLSGVAGRRPAISSSISSSKTPGSNSPMSRSSSYTPPAVGVVSQPRSSIVAPST